MTGIEALGSPRTAAGREGLGYLVAHPDTSLLVLDFDGTLAPIVEDPEQARAHPGVVPALVALAPKLGGIAVVTGRPADVAVEYGGFADTPGLERLIVLGHYGAQRWTVASGLEAGLAAGEAHPTDAVAAARAELDSVLASAQLEEPAHIEDKGGAFAVHTRRMSDPAGGFARLEAPMADLADRHGLRLEPGRFVLEIRPAGANKGDAVRALVAELNPSTVVAIGDDLGDLAAFDAIDVLRDQGLHGVLVCSGSTEVAALADRADLVVAGPPGVVEWLHALAEHLSGARSA